MSARPEVSVVLSSRNEESRIARAIRSLLEQTLTTWELIAIDDGSADGTASVVESFGDPRIRLFRSPPRGLAASLNRGISLALAPLVARQDADDYSLPDRLERQAAFLRERPDVAVVGSAWEEVGRSGEPVTPRVSFVAGDVTDVLPRFNPLTHTTVMFRKDAVVRVGGYDETLPYAQDYDLWLRLARAGEVIWNVDEALAGRVMTGENVAARRERAQVRAELRARWSDLRQRRAAGLPHAQQARALAGRIPVFLAPVPLKGAVRRLRGKA